MPLSHISQLKMKHTPVRIHQQSLVVGLMEASWKVSTFDPTLTHYQAVPQFNYIPQSDFFHSLCDIKR